MSRTIILLLTLLTIASCSVQQSREHDEKRINALLNAWHQAAAEADENTFFNTFTQDGIYIGTDATELWTAPQLANWSAQYFERESAWDFKPYDRNIYFSHKGDIAWFDELLETWMGTCRASGVLEKQGKVWRLKHYHLAIAVPNEVVEDYLRLIRKR
ncbi:MAG: nuclear transport factor 2 family protein [Weeksellaceae bacterium]|nr:nuclear transport factor 2 family protein [Weeksellaceae bacterium]